MSVKVSRIIIIMYIILYISGCDFINFNTISVKFFDISEEFFYKDELCFSFSEVPALESVKKVLVLKENKTPVDFNIRQEGNYFFIKPKNKWISQAHYELFLTGMVAMLSGGHYSFDEYIFFTYGTPEDYFYLQSFENPQFSQLHTTDTVILRFNCEVDKNSFYTSFKLSPHIAVEYDFSSTGDVYVIPLEPWKLNTRYTWSVSQLRSKNNALINKSYSEDFVYRENTEFPVLERMCGSFDSGMLRDRESITLLFSKSMDTSSLEKSIFVTPSMPGVLRSTEIPGEYKWFPLRNWQQETEYRFFVSNSAKDCDGLSLQKSYEKFFSVFNSYLTVDYIHFLYNEKPINLKQDSLKNLSAKLDTDSEYNSLPISVVFSSPIPEENRIVAVEGIGLSCIFPITGARPILYKVDWDESGKIVTLYWNNITVSSQDVTYYYELKITGGEKAVTNVLGDYLKEDVCVTFACQ